MDVCFVVMPFGSVHRAAIGMSLLEAALKKIRVNAKIHYFNSKFAERIGLKLNDQLESGRTYALIGELIFASYVFAKYAWKK